MTSCDSFDVLVEDIFAEFINNSSWIFIITVEGNLTEFEEFISNVHLNKFNRQLLITAFEDEKEITYITKLSDTQILFNSTHLPTKYDKVIFANYIQNSMRHGCDICIRFTRLIDYRFFKHLKVYENEIEDYKCDKNCFLALLNLPYDFNFERVSNEIFNFLQERFIRQLSKAKVQALKIGHRITIEKFLLENTAIMNLEGLSALAWSHNEYEVFEFLIRAECPYPKSYQVGNDKNFNFSYVKEINEFHKNIELGNLEEVKNFLKAHKNLTFARNILNKSALQVALENEQWKVYSYLRSHDMMLSDVNEMGLHYQQRQKLSETKKKMIRQLNLKNMVKVEEINLINKLMLQSSISYNHKKLDKEFLKSELRRAFIDLNELIPELLKVVAVNDRFEMVFDFDNEMVDDIDPSHENNAGSAFRNYALIATVDLLSDDVYDRDYVLGVMAHEIMHSAMNFLYDNDMKPYTLGDKENILKMNEIAEVCKIFKNESSLIKSVFKDDDRKMHGELIARVPDMIVTNRNLPLELIKKKEIFKSLFDFYEQKVIKDIREMLPAISTRIKINQFNEWFGLVEEIHRLNESTLTDFTDEEITVEADTKVQIFITNHVRSVLRKIYEKTMRKQEFAIFLKSSFATAHDYFKNILYEIDRIREEVLLVIYCDSNFPKLKEFRENFNGITLEKMIFVGREESRNELLKLNFGNINLRDLFN